MKVLEYCLKLTERELKIMLYNYLCERRMSPVFEDGFLYAKGNIPIMLVAHMDTVFDTPPSQLCYYSYNDELFSYDGGIGGDDRCGIYAIIKILENFRPYVLFTEEEEIGGIGAMKAVEKLLKPNVKYIIELDRRGNNDCVFYDCGNYEFINYIESFGFKTNYGTFSDISVLGSAWDIAAVNLSCGYYNEHTDNEYIKFKELQNNILRVKAMIRKQRQAEFFDYQEIKYVTPNYYYCLNKSSVNNSKLGINNFYSPMYKNKQKSNQKRLKKELKTKMVINNENE